MKLSPEGAVETDPDHPRSMANDHGLAAHHDRTRLSDRVMERLDPEVATETGLHSNLAMI